MTNSNYLIEVSDLHKSFGELKVLKGVSEHDSKGEVVSIIGPSGSGKSTLLRCAAMLETMDGGDLAYLGKQAVTMENGKSVYAKPAVLRKIQENFGMVFQSFHLFPHYNVMKNLNVSFDVAMDILGFTKNEKIILKEYLKNKKYLLTF